MTQADTDLLARCARIGSSTWSDALDTFGIQGVVEGITRRSGDERIVGFAMTARQVTGELGQYDRADFAVGKLVAACGPGCVLMVDVDGAPISTFGGIASTAAKAQGATGVIIDGACRDVDEIREAGLWMASRWVSPRTGKTRLQLQELGQAVTIGSVRVHQGDVVVGDDTGIVVIPRGEVEKVLAEAERILEVDVAVEKGIKEGKTFAQAAAAANYIPEKTRST
jgi:3-hexulose-6-phosphate synthase/6-phospho-3-hexuloisomerase